MTTKTDSNRRARRMAREPSAAFPATISADSCGSFGAGEGTGTCVGIRAGSKTEQAVALLRREQGATNAELTGLTGWLPHTNRAALTGLRKKGHVIERSKRGDETCYRIAPRALDDVKAG